MYKEFQILDELINCMVEDKQSSGDYAAIANRYPVRFVLFDNFPDSFNFVSKMQNQFGCTVESVDTWLDANYCDSMITHSKLAAKIEEYIHSNSQKNCVIAPFSELARFYNNKDNFEFNALIATAKAIQTKKDGCNFKQRIYLPIVGLEGKISKFRDDTQAFIWYFKNTDRNLNYKLILTNNTTFDIHGLDTQYTIVENIKEWLKIWRNKNAKHLIISTSPAIFANAEYAQPDNAFDFCICNNVYEFLTNGLNLDFGTINYRESDCSHWERLAQEINVNDFSFEKFFNKYFAIYDLSDYKVFLKTWFECKDEFEKWLLTSYYANKFCQKGYICESVKRCRSYTNQDLFASIALTIFELEDAETNLEERSVCLQYASQKQIKLTDEVNSKLAEKLNKLSQENSYTTAIRYLSPLTDTEKAIAITWLGNGNLTKEDIKTVFPELYYYLGKSFGTSSEQQKWVLEYINCYKTAKIANKYTAEVKTIICNKNASESSFNDWYHNFKTTSTALYNRTDIEVFYWIDGLGVDWIPFISKLLENRRGDKIYLNEVYIARAQYPSTTEINKISLFELSKDKLLKKGDLDSFAHKTGNKYPDYIIDEIAIVKTAIYDILTEYAGKKIAIVSDHGLTALSQFCDGLNMAGVTSDHSGRIAKRIVDKCVSSNDYIVLDDSETMCALKHESLCSKVPVGQSAHGGCTPEEILVPIFIISSQPNAKTWTAKLINNEISGTNPVLNFSITGLSGSDIPHIVYNNKQYELSKHANGNYISSHLKLVENITDVTLNIGHDFQSFQLQINLGAEEDDLFNI
jgi:hypothetical protein